MSKLVKELQDLICFTAVPIAYLSLTDLLLKKKQDKKQDPYDPYPVSSYAAARPFRSRFPENADTAEEAVFYLKNRATQGLVAGMTLSSIEFLHDWGVLAQFSLSGDATLYYSLYILNSHRGCGKYSQWLRENKDKVVITLDECNISELLIRRRHPHKILHSPIIESTEYRLVRDFYGDHCAARTGLHYINHIDEGLFVLREIGASALAMKAFIMHPLLQGDVDFAEFYEHMSSRSELSIMDPKVIMLATEYRSVANEYLSYKPSGTIRLSPLKEVNDMLIADKIQNRKDFELFHSEYHEHRERLKEYFREWLCALQVSEEMYQAIKRKLLTSVHGEGNPERVAKSSILDFLAVDAMKRAI
jgi:hypothetical protein